MTEAELVKAFGWGDLQHHDMPCKVCEDEDDREYCSACAGEGTAGWGSFYGQKGECDNCNRENVFVAGLFENGHGTEYTCLPCYMVVHKIACGCDLWSDAEKAIAGE